MGTVSDFIFGLLPAALRRGPKTGNQLYIFCRAIGGLYTHLMDDVRMVHSAGMVLAAPESLLAEHGRDRDMPRLPGETAETYRMRLAMAAQTAEMAGTRAGILAAMAALGLPSADLQPYRERDADRWAEFIVWLRPEPDADNIRLANVDREIRRLKPVGAKPNYGLAPATAKIYMAAATKYGLHITIAPRGETI